jgi:KDO2-lipid IV(A) lauroyltransferase
MSQSNKKRRTVKKILSFLTLPGVPVLVIMTKLPVPIVRVLAAMSGLLFSTFGIPWKNTAMKNLDLVYGDMKTVDEKKHIAKKSMDNVLRMFLECPALYRKPEKYIKTVKIEGEENITKALEQGRGVLALGCHVGHFLLLINVLNMKGYPISYIYKETKNERFKTYVKRIIENLRLNAIPMKPKSVAAKRALRVLRNNGILWVALDQSTREGAMGVEFFGVKTATSQGPAVLAMKTNAVVLPMSMRRNGFLDHTLIVREPLELPATTIDAEGIYKNLLMMNGMIEKEILVNPEEWWWFHRRWKRAHRYLQENEASASMEHDFEDDTSELPRTASGDGI